MNTQNLSIFLFSMVNLNDVFAFIVYLIELNQNIYNKINFWTDISKMSINKSNIG